MFQTISATLTRHGRLHLALSLFLLFPLGLAAQDASATPEGKVWRTVQLDIRGPRSSETADPNPFTDYRLDVTFSLGEKSYRVPGFFAACGDAAVSGCSEGNVWRVLFTPDEPGEWTYVVSFLAGKDVAVTGEGKPLQRWHRNAGRLRVAAAADGSTDPRDRGRLVYDGTRYLKYASSGEVFFKAGADAPENMLAYDDFDATPNVAGRRKNWAPHLGDATGLDLEPYTWNGKGKALLGAINYLHQQGMNAVSFLTFNVAGDDMNVFPHLLKVSVADYEAIPRTKEERGQQWTDGVHHDRFDVSKMDQWQKLLSFASDNGLFLHFKLQETENDNLMDGGATGRERTVYLREMAARFGHFLALNWNFGEENNRSASERIDMINAMADIDPYDHLRVIHTYPNQKPLYADLLGERSELTGVSLQGCCDEFADVRPDTVEWISRSEQAGHAWVVSYDEPGSAQGGVPVDAAFPADRLPSENRIEDFRRHVRQMVLWNVLLAGGTGVEYYYGYRTGCSDLDCQDHRTRETKWSDARQALAFMRAHLGGKAARMTAKDDLSPRPDDFVFADNGDTYAIYLPDGEGATVSVQAGEIYEISWYNPVMGGPLANARQLRSGADGLLNTGTSSSRPTGDWVVLMTRVP